MNKKFNYFLFIIAATALNIIIMGLLFIVPLIILILVLKENIKNIMPALYIFLPLLSIGGGYVIYSKLYTLFREKVPMEKYFEPIFKKK